MQMQPGVCSVKQRSRLSSFLSCHILCCLWRVSCVVQGTEGGGDHVTLGPYGLLSSPDGEPLCTWISQVSHLGKGLALGTVFLQPP